MGVMATTWDHLPEFIPRIPFIGGAMWMSKDNRDDEGLNHTITASWLRKVFPGEDYFNTAGTGGRSPNNPTLQRPVFSGRAQGIPLQYQSEKKETLFLLGRKTNTAL